MHYRTFGHTGKLEEAEVTSAPKLVRFLLVCGEVWSSRTALQLSGASFLIMFDRFSLLKMRL